MPCLLSPVLLAVAVVATGNCPSAAEVQEHLRRLLSAAEANEASRDQFTLRELQDGSLELELRSNASGTLLRRHLPARASCAEQAEISATVIAAWQLETQSALPTPTIAPVITPVVTPQGTRPALSYELSAALVTALAAAGATAGGWLEANVALCACRVSARLGLLGVGLRSLSLEPGRAVFTRAAARLGVGYRILPRAWALDVAADLPLAFLYAMGEGFDSEQRVFGFDVGLSGSLRLGRRLGPLRLFFDAALFGWLRPSRLTVAGGDESGVELPRIEGLLSVGLTYAGGRTREKTIAP